MGCGRFSGGPARISPVEDDVEVLALVVIEHSPIGSYGRSFPSGCRESRFRHFLDHKRRLRTLDNLASIYLEQNSLV